MLSLESIVAELRALDDTDNLSERIAARATGKLRAGLEASLAAGTTPEGEAWVERKTGGRAYKGAANRLTVKSDGNLLYAVVDGPEAWAQFGTSKLPVRKMLPDGGGATPIVVENAITAAAQEILNEVVGAK